MPRNIIDKRTVLLAHGDPLATQKITTFIQQKWSDVQFFYANNVGEISTKISNSPPHIVIMQQPLNSADVYKVVQWALDNKSIADMAFILISEVPEEEQFVDEIVVGRVQFLPNINEGTAFELALSRALNYLTHDGFYEFNLKFLAPSECLIKEGDHAEFVYIVKKGELQASIVRDDNTIVLGPVHEGEFVGEMAYINGEKRSADVYATSYCELIEVPISKIDLLLFQKPSWSKAFMQTLSKRLKKANEPKDSE